MPRVVAEELIGRKFGLLTVISTFTQRNAWGSTRYCECQCDCGERSIPRYYQLNSGSTISCGCYKPGTTTHGMSGTPEYKIWGTILHRCRNPNCSVYEYYGARGITVCERWLKFENFYEDMGGKPFRGATIDRKNNDGNYCPENCRWATMAEQNRNKRCRKKITRPSPINLLDNDWSI